MPRKGVRSSRTGRGRTIKKRTSGRARSSHVSMRMKPAKRRKTSARKTLVKKHRSVRDLWSA